MTAISITESKDPMPFMTLKTMTIMTFMYNDLHDFEDDDGDHMWI